MDQEFGAVWLEEGDVFLVLLVEARAQHARVAEE
jgi:translation initiation factor IF-1